MYLEDAQTLAGNVSFTDPDGSTVTGHQGDGYCRITVIEAGYIATYMADGQVVKTETLSPGAHINPPNVSKTGYDTAWTVNGEVIDVSSYLMPESNITITAVFTPQVFSVLMYDSGITTVQQATYGSSVTLPEGTHGTGEFVGWWYNGQLVTSLVMPAQSVYLIARYDLSGSRITVDSVSLQPNPIDAGQTVLLTVSAMATDSEVPRWTDLAITADTGLPMSSPYQAQIWDTSQEDPLAVFEGDGIKTTGRDVPPLSAQTMPLPRVGIWSDAISDSGGNLDYTIHGSGSEQYTSSIVLFSSQEVSVREAKITYHSGGSSISHVATSDSDQMTFPTGTYTSFDIQITKVSKGFSHVRILNVAPGGV